MKKILCIQTLACLLLCIAAGSILPGTVLGGDWPMYRCDASRSGFTPDALPARLSLSWELDLGTPKPAWEYENRMHFDMCYEPVVLGSVMFVASNRNDRIYAFDTKTGKEKWSVFTHGPVRFAPAVEKDNLFFVSDDGFLYCLNAENGDLKWKVRGGEEGRFMLGNERLISEWPARGGPVVKDGIVYFGAGIWPSYGTFIHAVNAKTGKTIWTNDSADAIKIKVARKRHGATGIAPQGYLAIVGSRLIVPNSRVMPGVFDLKTGKLLQFHPGQRSGNIYVSGMGEYHFVGQRMFHTETGVVMYNTLGKLLVPPVLTSDAFYLTKRPGKGGPKIKGRSRRNADRFIGQTLSGIGTLPGDTHFLTGYRFKDVKQFDKVSEVVNEQHKVGDYGLPKSLEKYGHGSLNQIQWKSKIEMDSVFLKAGKRLYGTLGSRIVSAELGQGSGSIKKGWEVEAEGRVGSMIAADGRLFVSTLEGKILCFGTSGGGKKLSKRGNPGLKATDPAAKEILNQTGLTSGYALVLGADDADFLKSLAAGSNLQIVVVEKDKKNVSKLRQELDAEGVYGYRVTVIEGDPGKVKLPPYFANLIVSGRKGLKISGGDLLNNGRCLRPYSGMVFFDTPSAALSAAGELSKATGTRVKGRKAGKYGIAQCTSGKPGAGNWTHHNGNAGNTLVGNDSAVHSPLKLLWFGGEMNSIPNLYHHSMPPRPQVIEGRMLIPSYGMLNAVDIYNGKKLWQTKIDGFAETYRWLMRAKGVFEMSDCYASAVDGIYAISSETCFHLDPATGKIISEFQIPPSLSSEKVVWSSIRVLNDTLIGTADDPGEGSLKSGYKLLNKLTASYYLFALDRKTGKLKWKKEAVIGFPHTNIVAGEGKVFCIDRLPKESAQFFKKRGTGTGKKPALRAFDLSTGKESWSSDNNIVGTFLRYSAQADVLVLCPEKRDGNVTCFQGKTGKQLWQSKILPKSKGRDVAVFSENLAMGGYLVDLLTGAKKGRTRIPSNTSCSDFVASINISTMRLGGTIGLADLKAGKTVQFPGTRPGCVNNAIPAGGLLTVPNLGTSCICNYHNQTSLAFVPESVFDK